MVLAPNPSPMTNLGTNTYLLGHSQIGVIDPGPNNDAHLAAILHATAGQHITHIFVTHNHLDHSPLSKRLSELTGARIHAYGTHLDGRSAVMADLVIKGLAGGGEGIDDTFQPDVILDDGDRIACDAWDLTAIHTPGHIGNHLSFVWKDAVFTGDHVMGWASSLVSPPDGDLTDFMLSCEKLHRIDARVYYAGHGAPILDPKARLDWLIGHRKTRTVQILDLLKINAATVHSLTRDIYTDVPAALVLAAQRNVFAHLIDLSQKGQVAAEPHLSSTAIFRILQEN